MDTVAAHARRRVDERDNFAAGLHELERDDESDVARTDHEDALAGFDAVKVHHGLRGAGSDDARKRPTGEIQRVLGGTGRHENRIALDVLDRITETNDDLAIVIESDDGGVEHNGDARLVRLGKQLLADTETADFGAVLLGAEELMDLLEELTARARVLIEHDDVESALGSLDSCGKTAWTSTDDNKVMTLHATHPPSLQTHPPKPPPNSLAPRRHVGRSAGHPRQAEPRRLACARPYRRQAESCRCVRWACRPRP